MAGSAPISQRLRRSHSRGNRRAGGSRELLNILLYGSAKRKQTLIDRGRHFADEFDHAATVLENARFPNQLVTELIDLGMVGRGRILELMDQLGPGHFGLE